MLNVLAVSVGVQWGVGWRGAVYIVLGVVSQKLVRQSQGKVKLSFLME